MHRQFLRIFFFIALTLSSGAAYCQPTWTFDPFGKEKKPDEYEEKILGSEKTATKKFTTFRRFVQNNVTHYNFYFNANTKLDAVIERAKLAQVDDYSKLLSFYPYSFANTSSQKVELDSVILKSTGGILLHDLRSDWVDDLYLLIGKAYFLRNELDSAALTFQFINYNLFPRKKKDDDDSKVIGGNSQASQGTLSIADKEKRNIVQKAFTKAPSRNESLLWLTRTLTEKKQFGDAAGMLNILHNDPNMPKRLINDLNEATAFWFYAQDSYDSSAVYLERALSAAENKQDLARWEYLLAQMLEMSGKYDQASTFYMKAAKHTVNPLMDIHAHLNEAKMARQNGNAKELENNISRLQKMAKKDKYESYRDIIYYSIAQLNLQMPDTSNGVTYYKKSIATPATSNDYKERSFLQLANIAYTQKKYSDAFAWYDSLMPTAEKIKVDFNLKERRDALANVVDKISVIELEDSLQRIAAMPAGERDAFLKKKSKALRKASGSKEEDFSSSSPNMAFNNSKNEPTDLFAPAKGEWYFYNSGLKSKGFSEFKSKWGKRENVDNWRRSAALTASTKGPSFGDPMDAGKGQPGDSAKTGLVENSYDALLQNLPLTQELLDSSNNRIAENMLGLAKIFQFEIQDYDEAIRVYDEYLTRFPKRLKEGEVYLNLYYCWNKKGDQAKAEYYKNLVVTKFNGTPSGVKISHPEYLRPDLKNPEVTARYKVIYDLFIEGKFDTAFRMKQEEDSIYGDTYWSPQLLYIEAIYHIRQKNDSMAIDLLTRAEASSTDDKFKQKMNTMIDVLGRRKAIETYLTSLEVTRVEETKVLIPVDDNQEKKITPASGNPSVVKPMKPVNRPLSSDSTIKAIPSITKGGFRLQSDKPHFVVMILDKVDQVYVNEAKNAFLRYNRNNFAGLSFSIIKDQLSADKQLLLISPFQDAESALVYFDKIKKAAPAEVSWLPKNKYSFIIINPDNLQLLKENKNLGSYIELLNNNYGNKF